MVFDGYEKTYYNLLIGEWHTSGPYGDDSLYQTALNYFIKQIPIYREIIDGMGNECEMCFIEEYLMMLNAVFTYYYRMGYDKIED
jgi:hypothetical protein